MAQDEAGHGNRGKAWEAQIERWHAAYLARGEAWVVQTPPPVKVMGPTKRDRRGRTCFPALWAGRGPPDYQGVLSGGRSVVFDAKDNQSSPRFDFSRLRGTENKKTGAWSCHQPIDLDNADAFGGAAFLAVQFENAAYVVWWRDLSPWWWRWHREGGAPASISPDTPIMGGPSPVDSGMMERMPVDGWLSIVQRRPLSPFALTADPRP